MGSKSQKDLKFANSAETMKKVCIKNRTKGKLKEIRNKWKKKVQSLNFLSIFEYSISFSIQNWEEKREKYPEKSKTD